MKLTKFAQSCILLETKGKKILIDPGYIQYDESLLKDYWYDIDILLVTHKHADHCHEQAVKIITDNEKTRFFTSKEVADAYPDLTPEIVIEGEIIETDNISIEVVRAVHGYTPLLKGGKIIDENIGFIINDGSKKVYVTSDTVCFENDYKCDILVVPVSAHGLVMSSFEAALFAKECSASHIIPCHMDNPKYPVDKEILKKHFSGMNMTLLGIKESIDV